MIGCWCLAHKKSPNFRYAHLQDFFNAAVWTGCIHHARVYNKRIPSVREYDHYSAGDATTLLHIFMLQHFYVNMFLFYVGAKEIKGEGTLKNMRETIEIHVHVSKNVMFAQAKDAMMKQLRDLKVYHILYFVIQK